MVNYPAGDFLIRVKNAAMATRNEVSVPLNKFNLSLAKALKEIGYLEEVKTNENTLVVRLKYSHKAPVLVNLRLISKPGLRIYKGADEVGARKERASILLLSTPKGIMSSKKAVKENVGGEIIAEIW